MYEIWNPHSKSSLRDKQLVSITFLIIQARLTEIQRTKCNWVELGGTIEYAKNTTISTKATPQYLVSGYDRGPTGPIYWGQKDKTEDFHRGKSRTVEDLESTDKISTSVTACRYRAEIQAYGRFANEPMKVWIIFGLCLQRL